MTLLVRKKLLMLGDEPVESGAGRNESAFGEAIVSDGGVDSPRAASTGESQQDDGHFTVTSAGGSGDAGIVDSEPDDGDGGPAHAGDDGVESAADAELWESKISAAAGDVTGPDAESLESIVRDVLTRTYGRYWRTDDTEALERIVEILTDPALVNHPRFEAADNVRAVLWQGTYLGGPSAAATCNVFFAVGRPDELGPIARDAALYTEGILY